MTQTGLNEASLSRIVKLLNLSISPFDGESLACIRKVNEILKTEKLTWDNIFRVSKVEAEYNEESNRETEPYEYKIMFDFLISTLKLGKSRNFIESLQSSYSERHSLSQKQNDILWAIYKQERKKSEKGSA